MIAIKNENGENKGYLFKGEKIKRDDIPLKEYPRPQLVRDSYMSLNGLWDFTCTKSDKLPDVYDKKIMVPLPVEAFESQVGILPTTDDYLYYRRIVDLGDFKIKDQLVIHFDGIDQICEVFIDRRKVLTHTGYVDGFDVVLDKNTPKIFTITLKIKDESDRSYYQRGKQNLDPSFYTYTTTSGVYKPIWIESVPNEHITDFKYRYDKQNESLLVNVKASGEGNASICIGDKEYIVEVNKECTIKLDYIHLWSIDDPYLYNCTIKYKEDEVKSYFALRDVKIKKIGSFNRLVLNDKPLFLSGLLDQGYYSYNNLTPYEYSEFEKDISNAKALGFNCLRVHVKVECDMFYYLADKLGIYLIQDFPCGGPTYKFLPTVLPRVLASYNREEKLDDGKLSRTDEEGKKEFIKDSMYIVDHLYSHPSILIFTIFNEGWGEFTPSKIYDMIKERYSDVLLDSASGWYEADKSDFFSIHTYSKPLLKRKNRFDRCYIISEAGGVGLKMGDYPYKIVKGHGKVKSVEKLTKKIASLYTEKILPQIKDRGLTGFIYTQIADVETEANGLYDLTRNTLKVDLEEMKRLNESLYQEYDKETR